jgi:hypothetical protein
VASPYYIFIIPYFVGFVKRFLKTFSKNLFGAFVRWKSCKCRPRRPSPLDDIIISQNNGKVNTKIKNNLDEVSSKSGCKKKG